MKGLIKQIVDEYWKSAVALLIQTVSIGVIYKFLVSYFHLQSYVLPRSVVVIALLLAGWACIRFFRLKNRLKYFEHPKLTEDQEFILSMHKDLPLGNGQCASTLLEGQNSAHPQEAQYHLDVLNNLQLIKIINPLDLEDEEPLYRLTDLGRKYLYEKISCIKNGAHNKRLHADAQTYALFVGFAALTLPQKALRSGRW